MQGSECARKPWTACGCVAQLGRLVQMALKNRILAGNSKLVAAAAVTSLAIHSAASASDRDAVPDEVLGSALLLAGQRSALSR
jgi:hypothetical protein